MVKVAKKARNSLSVEQYTDGIINSDVKVLSKAITVVESTLRSDADTARQVVEKCLPRSGNSIRIGVSGVPGVGKSTFIDAFGTYLTDQVGRKVAVLTVDPSSQITKGSILGDKIRMTRLSKDPNAYIRTSPSSGFLGGVAARTREVIVLCEAAGFDTVIVETVGVGQSETSVHRIVDFFLLLHLAGAGDEIQGIKRGIMELADAVVVNKCDGPDVQRSRLARKQIEGALSLFPVDGSGWKPRALTCSSLDGTGIDEVWSVIKEKNSLAMRSGYFESNRRDQAVYWIHETVTRMLKDSFYACEEVQRSIDRMKKDVADGKISPFHAAEKLMGSYRTE